MKVFNFFNVYLLSYVVFPVILIKGIKKNKDGIVLDKDSTISLKGLFVIYVAIHHYVQIMVDPFCLGIIRNIGFLCVSFFFFMSGYGLSASFKKIKHFFLFLKKDF